MIRLRSGVRWLALLGLAACATAQESGVPQDDGHDAAGGSAAMTAASSGAHNSPGTAGAFANGGASTHGGASGSSAGSSGVGGASAGSSGSAGTAGSGGTAGNAGTGGSAGTAPVFLAGACAPTPTMSLSYKQGSSSSKQITGQYQFINTSDVPIPLASLKIRYFFSNEETSGWTTAIYDAKLEGGTLGYRPISGATLAVIPLGVTLPGADSYTDLAFASALTIEKGATATVSWDMQPHSYNAPDQVQSDDYSYDAAATGFTVWDHVVIYQGSAAVWGCAPGDTLGNGGSSGASSGSGGASAGSGGASAGSGGASAGSGGASAGSGGASAGSGGASAGSGGASAGSGGASAGSGGASAGSGGASAGAGGESAGAGGSTGGVGGTSAGSGGVQVGAGGSTAGATQ